MRVFRYLVISFLFIALPSTLMAGVSAGSFPDGTKWYVHVDFEEMRSTEAGRHLYGWLQDEVFEDIREDVGVDLDKEADTLTAYSAAGSEMVLVLDGSISQQTEDKLVAMGAASGSLDRLGSGNKAYYHVGEGDGGDDSDVETRHVDIDVDSFDDGAYFSFAVKGKLIVTSTAEDMQSMLANKGRIKAVNSGKGALVVLSAERDLMQAGVKADELGAEVGWNSNILRNTEQAALLVADDKGKIAIEAQLVAAKQEMADSLASIVRGLISLQIFNDELDPEIASFLQNTTVNVDGTTLKVRVALDPEVVVATLE